MSDNLLVLDAASVNHSIRATDDGGILTPHHVMATLESGVPTPVTALAPLPVALPTQYIDSFSRFRTADPGYRFDSQFTNQIDNDLWDQLNTGDGAITHSATNRSVAVVSGTTAGANTATLQSHYHAPYTPGRGQLVFITFSRTGAIPTNGEIGVGYYDGTNGIYLKQTASGLSINRASSTTAGAESVAQASWNIDPLDGTGPSGITIDTTKTNILVIQLQALYVGRVVCALDIDGQLMPFHAFNHANSATYPYIAQASLPVRYWSKTSTDASTATINAICASVISEGGQELQGIPGRQFVASGLLSGAAPKIACVVIRPKAQLNSINQNALTIPTEVDVAIAGAGAWIEVRRNATVTAGTFTDVSSLSTMEACFAGNAGTDPAVTADTGTLIDKFYVPAAAQSRTSDSSGLLGKALLAYSHLLSTADNLAVIIDGGASTDAYVAVKWKEIR